MADNGDDIHRMMISGYGLVGVDTVISVDDVARAAGHLGRDAHDVTDLDSLIHSDPLVRLDGLVAGYGHMEILHAVDLRIGAGQSLCLIGPNGAGKSTVL